MIRSAFTGKRFIRGRFMGLAIGMAGLLAAVGCADLGSLDAAAAQAIVQNVDSLSGEVTVQFKDGTTTTFNLEDVDVEALGQLIGDASLQPGDEIEVELDSSNNVQALTPQVAKAHATVVSVSGDDTITLEAENGVEFTLNLTEQTRIEINDEHGTVDDLVAGLAVKVKYNADTDDALKIETEDAEDEDEGHEFRGEITAIDSDAHTVTVLADNGTEDTYEITAGTEIKIHGPAHFGDLAVGMRVKVELASDGTVEEIKVDDGEHGRDDDHDDEGKTVGTITALDPDGHSITVQLGQGIERTFDVDSETEIDVREDAEFSDLEVGMMVEIKFYRNSLLADEIKAKFDNSGQRNAHEAIDAAHDRAEDDHGNPAHAEDDHDVVELEAEHDGVSGDHQDEDGDDEDVEDDEDEIEHDEEEAEHETGEVQQA